MGRVDGRLGRGSTGWNEEDGNGEMQEMQEMEMEGSSAGSAVRIRLVSSFRDFFIYSQQRVRAMIEPRN